MNWKRGKLSSVGKIIEKYQYVTLAKNKISMEWIFVLDIWKYRTLMKNKGQFGMKKNSCLFYNINEQWRTEWNASVKSFFYEITKIFDKNAVFSIFLKCLIEIISFGIGKVSHVLK